MWVKACPDCNASVIPVAVRVPPRPDCSEYITLTWSCPGCGWLERDAFRSLFGEGLDEAVRNVDAARPVPRQSRDEWTDLDQAYFEMFCEHPDQPPTVDDGDPLD